MKIDQITGCVIKDSRGDDTLEVDLQSAGVKVTASVPSGKSKGETEAAVIAPQKGLEKLPWILSQIKDTEFATLQQFDDLLMTLDGTPNKSNLGGNLILALSIAFVKLLAKQGNLEIYQLISKITNTPLKKFPWCFYNLIEGGVHVNLPGGGLPFQEYLLVPQTESPKISLQEVMQVIKVLGEKIQTEFGQLNMGDEGGYAVPSEDPAKGLEILKAVAQQLTVLGGLSLDIAASALFKDNHYQVDGKAMNRENLLTYLLTLQAQFSLLSMEDPFDQTDWEGFAKITQELGEKVWIVGDDLTTTNPKRIKEALEKEACNAVIIKPNQIGSISETIQAVKLAQSYGWKVIVSHRSGETMDTFLADLAYGLQADGLKAGCPLQKERLVKYQRLIEIENSL